MMRRDRGKPRFALTGDDGRRRRLPCRWTWQNRTGIGFAGILRLVSPETFSGSMRDRKSHAHARILRNSPMIPLCDGPEWWSEMNSNPRTT
jgi:hypothetical protein